MESRWKDPKNSKQRSSSCFSVFYVLLFLDLCTGFRLPVSKRFAHIFSRLCHSVSLALIHCISLTYYIAGLPGDQAHRFNPTVFCNLVKQPKTPFPLLFSLGSIIAMLSLLALFRFSLTKFKERSTAHLALSAKVLNLPTLLLQFPLAKISSPIEYKIALTCFHIVSGTTPLYALSCFISTLLLALFAQPRILGSSVFRR